MTIQALISLQKLIHKSPAQTEMNDLVEVESDLRILVMDSKKEEIHVLSLVDKFWTWCRQKGNKERLVRLWLMCDVIALKYSIDIY